MPALPLSQIAALYAEDYYKFEAYISPTNLAIIKEAISKCKIVGNQKHKFEHSITDNRPVIN